MKFTISITPGGRALLKSWREECGVFGIWNDSEASRLNYLGLYALQHRGQESAGIVTRQESGSLDESADAIVHHNHKGLGLVADVFSEEELDRLKGSAAIGHVRYSTTGQNLLTNAQPITAKLKNGPIAIAHNGNLTNSKELREELIEQGAIFQGTNDTEIILHLLSREPRGDFIGGLKRSLKRLEGAFSLVILSRDYLIAARDSYGFRPLVLGRRKNPGGEESPVISSETCAFDLIGARFEREIEPGEIFYIDKENKESSEVFQTSTLKAPCVFEHVYFARPDSVVFGKSVYESRKAMGAQLARENVVEADYVIPVPDSGVAAAIGYSAESGIPFELGIIRNHYVGRTFIEPKQNIRSFGVKVKLNPQMAILKNKKVIVIDDSIVRGTTSRKIIELIRNAGAKEVHLRVAAPPTINSCYYGVDTPDKEDLIANNMNVDQIRDYIKADTLSYLSMDGLFKAVNKGSTEFCAACFNNKYPIQPKEQV